MQKVFRIDFKIDLYVDGVTVPVVNRMHVAANDAEQAISNAKTSSSVWNMSVVAVNEFKTERDKPNENPT